MQPRHLYAILPVLLTASAGAQTPIGAFTGTDSDGFETQTPFSLDPCIIERVFSDQADLCTPAGSGATIDSSMTFSCTITPNSGSFLYGSEDGPSEISFDTPVTRFGAMFAVNNPCPDARAIFWDCNDDLIGLADLAIPADCTWVWHGWEAPAGQDFMRIQIISNDNPSLGAYLQIDDMEADFLATCVTTPGTKQCFGDGVDNVCPCGNDNDSSSSRGNLAGCANSSFSGGCNLTGFGSNSVAAGDLVLCFDGAVPGQPGLMYGGTARLTGLLFGDGIRCCGGSVTRLELLFADSTGAGCTTVDIPAVSGPLPGESWCYQYWYRDPGGPCATGFNLSNAFKVLWTP